MAYTNFPNMITSGGVPVIGGVGGIPLTGKWWFCNYATGSDGNADAGSDGATPDAPLKTIERAHTLAVAGRNDVVVIMGDGSTTATQRLTGTLTWSKNATHLIGIESPTPYASRARISHASVAPTTAFTPMVLVTASGCIFSCFGIFEGFAQTGTAVVTWEDQGNRNWYNRVSIGAMGNLTANTSFAQAGSAAMLFTGGGEHYLETCAIGLDTVPRTAANASVRFRSQAARIWFQNCDFPMYATATTPLFIDTNAASSLNRWVKFKGCSLFNVQGLTSSASLVAGIAVNAAQNGDIRLEEVSWYGMDDLVAADSARVLLNMPIPSDDMGGQMLAWDQTP